MTRTASSPLLLVKPTGNRAGEDAEMPASPDREAEAEATAFSAKKIALPLGSTASPRAIRAARESGCQQHQCRQVGGGQTISLSPHPHALSLGCLQRSASNRSVLVLSVLLK